MIDWKEVKKLCMIVLYTSFAVWIYASIQAYLALSAHAYTIVDTVYVPDSITVTMSWEEWEEYLYWTAPDSGRSGRGHDLDSAWLQSDSLVDTAIIYEIEATINTLHIDTTNFANLHFKDLEIVRYVVSHHDLTTPERQIFSDTNYAVDPATAIIINELMDCMEDYNYVTVVWYEEF